MSVGKDVSLTIIHVHFIILIKYQHVTGLLEAHGWTIDLGIHSTPALKA